MDPLTLQASNLGVVRPAIALQSDLSAVLREGRVLAGEVLQSFGGGALLIGIGRHRVPAQGHVALEEGHRFLFVVEGEGEELALRVLPGAANEPSLLRALRGVLGQDQPLGRLLASLMSALGNGADTSDLARELLAHAARPEQGAPALIELLRGGGGLALEARLAAAAALRLPSGEAARLGSELEAWLAERLTAGGGLPSPATGHSRASELVEGLRAQVAALLGVGAAFDSREQVFAAWLMGGEGIHADAETMSGLDHLLEQALARMFRGALRDELVARLARARLPALGRGLEALLLRRLLGLGAPPAALAEEAARRAATRVQGDLKGHLLRALEALADGPQREAVTRALGGLEAEQLLNVARRDGGEAIHWSLPVVDGERWTTAHLFVEPRRSSEGEEGGADGGDGPWRLTLAIDLSCTGPLQADLLARPSSLLVRVRASRPEVVGLLSERLGELEARLTSAARSVQIVVAQAAAEELAVEDVAADVRYLREHHLMDLSA